MKNERIELTCNHGETFLPLLINNWANWTDSYGGMMDHAIKTRNETFPGHLSITETIMISESIYSTADMYMDECLPVHAMPPGMEEFDFWMLYTIAKLSCPTAVMHSNIDKQLVIDYAKWLLRNSVDQWSIGNVTDTNGLDLIRNMWRRNVRLRPLSGKTFSIVLNSVLAASGVTGITFLDRPISPLGSANRTYIVPIEMYEDMYRELIDNNYLDTVTGIIYRYANDIIRLSDPGADGFYNPDYLVRNNAIRLR